MVETSSLLATARSSWPKRTAGPVSFLEATGGDFRRSRHVTHLVVGVLKEYAGRGSEPRCSPKQNAGRARSDFATWSSRR